MAKIDETPVWEPEIYKLTTDAGVLGFNIDDNSDGPSNVQAQQLANRTLNLKGAIESIPDYREFTFYITESDPDGTIAGLAKTPAGEFFRVAQGPGNGFVYYLNDNGIALEVSSTLGESEFRSRFFNETIPGIKYSFILEDGSVVMYGDDLGVSNIPNLSLKDGSDIAYNVLDIPFVSHVETDEDGNVLRWVDDQAISHSPRTIKIADGSATTPSSANKISPQIYENALISEIGYNQWINNIAVKVGNTYLFSAIRLGSMTPKVWGNLSVSRRIGERGKFGTYEFGPRGTVGATASSDDHDAPSILVDTRIAASKPIMIFQADHSGANSWLRCWSSQTLDPANLGAAKRVSNQGQMTYSQSYRNPKKQDEIVVFSRYGNSNSARWYFHISSDNGNIWRSNSFIGGDDLYMTSCQSLDGDSIHLAIQKHPRSDDTRVIYLKLLWDGKSLVNAAGNEFAHDIMHFDYYDPFTSDIPDVVFSSTIPENTKRLFEVKETTQSILFLIAEFHPINFNYRRMKMVQMTSAGLTVFDVADCGEPMAIDGTLYVAGGCIVSDTDVFVATWSHQQQDGKIARYRFDGAQWNETLVEFLNDGRKLCRPLIFKSYYQDGSILKYVDTDTLVYQRGDYNGYLAFDMDAVMIKI